MHRIAFIPLVFFSIMFISACANDGNANKDGEYDTTKKMVIDILQTEDGKKAVRELMTDEEIKKQLVIESDVVKESINNLLVSEKGTEMWSKLFKDSTFVEDFAKSMADEQKKLMKNLMNDADYQKQMLDLLQNPEITSQMLGLMKSQQFRSHLEKTIQETLETPLFQAKMTEVLLKAAEKKGQQEQSQGGEGGGNGDSGGGGQGGGNGSGGGGS